MIKTVVFDLGGVLIPLDFSRGWRALAPLCGCSTEEIQQRILESDLIDPFERGEIEPRVFVREMNRVLGLSVTYDEFRRLWSSIFPPRTLVEENLLTLLHREHRLLLLSNTNAIHFSYVREHYRLLRHFDDFVLSYELGVMKPAPGIYDETITRSGCRAEECFFTDDLEENIEAARRRGMDAERFISQPKLVEDLRARGIPL